AHEIKHKASLRASVTSELSLDDVRVPDAYRLPGVSSMRGPLSCLNEARYGIAWGVVGAARACFEAALDYSLARRPVGKPTGAVARRRPRAGCVPPAGGVVDAGAAVVPQRSPLRHRLGCGRRRPGLLRGGTRLLAGATAVRQADRIVPAHPAQAGRDDDRRQS